MTWFNSENSYEMICILKEEPISPVDDAMELASEMGRLLPEGARSSVIYNPLGAHGSDDPLRQRAELIWYYPARKDGWQFVRM